MDQLQYYLPFSYFLGIGPFRFDKLLKFFGSVEDAYKASCNDLKHVLSSDCAEKFSLFKKNFEFENELEKLKKNDIHVMCMNSSLYPQQLKNLRDPPICLYVKGNVDAVTLAHEQYFAIVGTRKASAYGIQMAQEVGKELAARGFAIVSGMALGIDGAAHRAALEITGLTIAVLGSGFSHIYPAEHIKLYEMILESGGAVISEFAPPQPALPGLFIARNRIIAALSRGIFVVEGAKTSGAYETGKVGLELDRDVFALPGSPTNERAETPNKLIQNGAYLLSDISDIFIRYNIQASKKRKVVKAIFSNDQKKIYNKILKFAKTADELALACNKPIYEVLSILSQLELSGDIQKNIEGKYQVM
jgi:DNA processing protein